MKFIDGLPMKDVNLFELAPGDILGLITDGVFECEDPEHEQFGEARVAELIREHQSRPAEWLAKHLFEMVKEYGSHAPQADDITIVLVRRLP